MPMLQESTDQNKVVSVSSQDDWSDIGSEVSAVQKPVIDCTFFLLHDLLVSEYQLKDGLVACLDGVQKGITCNVAEGFI